MSSRRHVIYVLCSSCLLEATSYESNPAHSASRTPTDFDSLPRIRNHPVPSQRTTHKISDPINGRNLIWNLQARFWSLDDVVFPPFFTSGRKQARYRRPLSVACNRPPFGRPRCRSTCSFSLLGYEGLLTPGRSRKGGNLSGGDVLLFPSVSRLFSPILMFFCSLACFFSAIVVVPSYFSKCLCSVE